ncbi:hypothetical protein DFW101_1739 [Solidesulfovibrio carbinoliphilus subsp. oakridgensis]|uniref:Lipoprotein n=1 Tax=Solidesulfovibrio carbinoliphilus subsp. oakridgensis TaxID=694327 RepID=G7Q925_9BACT|nr:hypothetical protein [Solidesulfovibrio carbinoliphilus]EHJ47747.1 hypothetical protein DFW101_1739 [Solidesulfovibrio carbinoliphilus subsp. oakridgensis]
MVLHRHALLFALLLCLLAPAPARAGQATEADERVDAFLDETAGLFGPTEADVVQRLGPPRDRQAMPFTSPHDDAPYEIITLAYDGLSVSLYSMEGGARQFFHQIRVTAGPACFARKICLGTPRERLTAALGAPEDVEDNVWRYSDMSGFNELSFTINDKGAIDSMTWTAEAD